MTEIRFTKMHGIGNDYVYIDCTRGAPVDDLNRLSRIMSDRHKGAGSDGLIAICASDKADFRMRMFNVDGSEGKMCGNGARCVGKYVYDKRLTDKTEVTLETGGGIVVLRLHVAGGVVESVTVDMGEPRLTAADIPVRSDVSPMIERPVETSRGPVALTAISMGNPHGVVFVSTLAETDVHGLGRELEVHSVFPDRANIEFAQVLGPSDIKMRVWERGSGETMACGTGACATAVAAALTGRCGRRAKLHLLGGDLDIFWDPADNHVYMTGPAATVYDGVYYLAD